MNEDTVNKELQHLTTGQNHLHSDKCELYPMPDGDWYFDPTLGYWETDQESVDERRQDG